MAGPIGMVRYGWGHVSARRLSRPRRLCTVCNQWVDGQGTPLERPHHTVRPLTYAHTAPCSTPLPPCDCRLTSTCRPCSRACPFPSRRRRAGLSGGTLHQSWHSRSRLPTPMAAASATKTGAFPSISATWTATLKNRKTLLVCAGDARVPCMPPAQRLRSPLYGRPAPRTMHAVRDWHAPCISKLARSRRPLVEWAWTLSKWLTFNSRVLRFHKLNVLHMHARNRGDAVVTLQPQATKGVRKARMSSSMRVVRAATATTGSITRELGASKGSP